MSCAPLRKTVSGSRAPDARTVLVLGLNPAWQKVLFFGDFVKGEVNRASETAEMPAGKGINCARAIGNLGGKALVCQFAGGSTGRKIRARLRKEGIPSVSVATGHETRTCTTCVCLRTGSSTELIEPSGRVEAPESKALLEKVLQRIRISSALAICGTFPPGLTSAFYARVACEAARVGIPVLLDSSSSDLGDVLAAGTDILKVNRKELTALSGEKDIRRGALKLMRRNPLKLVAVTAGGGDAFLFMEDTTFRYEVPALGKSFVNSIGAGDTVAGVLIWEYAGGAPPEDAFGRALAAGTASCASHVPGSFDLGRAEEIAGKIRRITHISRRLPRSARPRWRP